MNDTRRRSGSRRAVIREKYVDLFDGDKAAALVLDQMIAWQRWADDQEGGDGWFYKSCRHLAEHDLFGLYGKSHVGAKLDKLTDAGFLQRREPESPTSAPDWHVDVRRVFDALPDGESVYGYNFGVAGDSTDRVHSPDGGVQSVDSPVQSVDGGVHSPDTTPAHNAGAPKMSTKDVKKKGCQSECSSAQAPTPERDSPDPPPDDTPPDDPRSELREAVSANIGAKAGALGYSLTDDEIDRITDRIHESKIPESAYGDYVSHEASRIRSLSGLRRWPGGETSVQSYLDSRDDIQPDVHESKRRNTSTGRRSRHWDDELDQDLIDRINENQGKHMAQVQDGEVSS